jgi:hypothetical protein
MDIREEFIKEKGYSYFNNTVLNEYAIWLEKKITDNYQALQLLQPDVSISLERAKKYARHQHYVGTQQREFVEFEDWAKD